MLTIALGLALGAAVLAAPAAAKGPGSLVSPAGIAVAGSPYRYVALYPGYPDELTVVARVNRKGGKVGRWWYLRGGYHVPAVALDGSPGGLSADGRRLVLVKHEPGPYPRGRAETKLAIVRPTVSLRRAPGTGRPHWVDFVRLRGEWALLAVSPDGATAFLSRYRTGVEETRTGLFRPLHPGTDELEVRALDTAAGELLPGPILDRDGETNRLDGIPYAQATSRSGRWTYTLYAGDRRQPFVYALDGVSGRGSRIDLPRSRGLREPYSLHLRLEDAERSLVLERRWHPDGRPRVRTVATVDTATFHVRGPRPRTYATSWRRTIARSTGGREIRLVQLGDPGLDGRVLVFGCVHGDECAARGIEPLSNGCPDPDSSLYVVPNLDPDGAAVGTRLNARGVDLNHNFPVSWRPIGERGDPQFSGPRPFSEPETRVAAGLIRLIEPRVTVWFHQHRGAGAFVRAWGQSIPAARELAAHAGIRFRAMPWLAGTAPHWQNERFPGTASFVVELPPGPLSRGLEERLERAILELGREVGED